MSIELQDRAAAAHDLAPGAEAEPFDSLAPKVPDLPTVLEYLDTVTKLADEVAKVSPGGQTDSATGWRTGSALVDEAECTKIREQFEKCGSKKVTWVFWEGEVWNVLNHAQMRKQLDDFVKGMPNLIPDLTGNPEHICPLRPGGDELLQGLSEHVPVEAFVEAYGEKYRTARSEAFPWNFNHKAALALARTRNEQRRIIGEFVDSEFCHLGSSGFKTFLLGTPLAKAFSAKEAELSTPTPVGLESGGVERRLPDPCVVFAEITAQRAIEMPDKDPEETVGMRAAFVEIDVADITAANMSKIVAQLDAAVAKQKLKGDAVAMSAGSVGEPGEAKVRNWTRFTLAELQEVELPTGTEEATKTAIKDSVAASDNYERALRNYNRVRHGGEPVDIYVAGMKLIFAAAGDPSSPQEILRLGKTGISKLPAILIFGELSEDRQNGAIYSMPAGPYNKNAGMKACDQAVGLVGELEKRHHGATAEFRLSGGDFFVGGIPEMGTAEMDARRKVINLATKLELNRLAADPDAWDKLSVKAFLEVRVALYREQVFTRQHPEIDPKSPRVSSKKVGQSDFGQWGIQFFKFPPDWRKMKVGEVMAKGLEGAAEPVVSFTDLATFSAAAFRPPTGSGRILRSATERPRPAPPPRDFNDPIPPP